MAAQDLLKQCTAPDREQIREHLSGNYCRCTGYQAIIDAVETTARGPRGIQSMTDASENPAGLSALDRPNSYIGKTVPRPNLERLMQGRGLYVSDVELPRMAHVVFLRSPHAHAKIIAIDADAAKRLPGVIAIVTGKELSAVITPWVGVLSHMKGLKSAPQHAIAIDHVCWQGEAVAAIVATSRAVAEDAAEVVAVEYQELDAVTDMRTALDPANAGDPSLARRQSRLRAAARRRRGRSGVRRLRRGGRGGFRLRAAHRRDAGAALGGGRLECRRGPADDLPGHPGAAHGAEHRRTPSRTSRIRRFACVCKDVGGSFGIKVHVYADEMATYALSKLLRRPIKYVADRVESFNTDIHARDHRCWGRIGVKRDGTITAFEIDDLTGIGPYSMYPRTSAIEANQVVNLVGGPYVTKNYRARTRVVFQNKNVMCQYRGVGHPIACSVTEGLVDLAALKIGMDPVEIRRRNLIADDAYPCASPSGLKFEQLSHHAAMNKLMAMMDYDGAARRAGRVAPEKHPSRHRHCQLHRDHQSECGVLRRRRRPDIVAGRRRGADGRPGFADLPYQHYRARAGLRIAHRADRRQRDGRLDGARSCHSRRYRQHALWRRHLGIARRRHWRRGRASGGEDPAQERAGCGSRDPAIHTGRTRHRQTMRW